jgi:hypothetical protein
VVTVAAVELGRFANRISLWQIQLNTAQRSKPFPDDLGEIFLLQLFHLEDRNIHSATSRVQPSFDSGGEAPSGLSNHKINAPPPPEVTAAKAPR